MGYITLGAQHDLQIEIPTQRTENWADRIRDNFYIRVVEHDHTGFGKGRPLGANSIANGAIDGEKILLKNDEFLQSAGVTTSSTVDIFKINIDDRIEQGASFEYVTINAVNADPVTPVEGQIQISDGTHRPAGIYNYDGVAWIAAPNNVTASNQGAGEGIFIQKTGDDLELKTLTAGNGIELASAATELEINTVKQKVSTRTLSADITAPGSSNELSFSNSNLELGKTYELYINVEATLNTGAVTCNGTAVYDDGFGGPIIDNVFNRPLFGEQSIYLRFTPTLPIGATLFYGNLGISINVSGDSTVDASNTIAVIKEVIISEQEGGF